MFPVVVVVVQRSENGMLRNEIAMSKGKARPRVDRFSSAQSDGVSRDRVEYGFHNEPGFSYSQSIPQINQSESETSPDGFTMDDDALCGTMAQSHVAKSARNQLKDPKTEEDEDRKLPAVPSVLHRHHRQPIALPYSENHVGRNLLSSTDNEKDSSRSSSVMAPIVRRPQQPNGLQPSKPPGKPPSRGLESHRQSSFYKAALEAAGHKDPPPPAVDTAEDERIARELEKKYNSSRAPMQSQSEIDDDKELAQELSRRFEMEKASTSLHDELLALEMSHQRNFENTSSTATDELLALELSREQQKEFQVSQSPSSFVPEQMKILEKIREDSEKRGVDLALRQSSFNDPGTYGVPVHSPQASRGDYMLSQQLALNECSPALGLQGASTTILSPSARPPEIMRRTPSLSEPSRLRRETTGTPLGLSNSYVVPSSRNNQRPPPAPILLATQSTTVLSRGQIAAQQAPRQDQLRGETPRQALRPTPRPASHPAVPSPAAPRASPHETQPTTQLATQRAATRPTQQRTTPRATPRVPVGQTLNTNNPGPKPNGPSASPTPVASASPQRRTRYFRVGSSRLDHTRQGNAAGTNRQRGQEQETGRSLIPFGMRRSRSTGLHDALPTGRNNGNRRSRSKPHDDLVRRGERETRAAMNQGNAHVVRCEGCNCRLHAPRDFSLVYCPNCQTVSPGQTATTSRSERRSPGFRWSSTPKS